MFELIGMLCAYALIIIGAAIVFGSFAYIIMSCGPSLLKFIKQTINTKWNTDNSKDNFDNKD